MPAQHTAAHAEHDIAHAVRFAPLGRLLQQRIDDSLAADHQPGRQHDEEQRQDHGNPCGFGTVVIAARPSQTADRGLLAVRINRGGVNWSCGAGGPNRCDDRSRITAEWLGDAHTGIKQGNPFVGR